MSEATAKRRQGWREVLGNLRQRKVLAMVLLGFSSGIPIYLVGNTLGFWMRENGIELSTIGFLSWVGLAYSLKFLWAPLVDKADAPLFGRWLGRRRGWMLLSQLVVAVLIAREPVSQASGAGLQPTLWTMRGVHDAIVGPFVAFFRQHGRMALLMLLAISLYRLPDFVMGPMANPFYADLGIAKETVGAVRGSAGLVATILGIAAAGLCAVRFGFTPTLLAGAVLGPGSNLAFAYLALHGSDAGVFTAAMVIDNFCSGFAGVALIGYMSSLTSVGYTATQYALLSSFYALAGKVLKGFSGVWVEQLSVGRSLMEGYAWFFTGTALIGIPALVLCALLVWKRPPVPPAVAAAGGPPG